MSSLDHEKRRRSEGHREYLRDRRPILITARFASSCRKCGGFIQPQEDAWWQKGTPGLLHPGCYDPNGHLAEDAAAREEFAVRKRSGLSDPKAEAYVERVKRAKARADERWKQFGRSA